MSNCCKALNPLRRDGTSQPQRFPLPLAESYVKLDERSISDILNFTGRLAQEFNYYNGANSISGTWVEFFQEDLSFILANIGSLDLEAYRNRFDALHLAVRTYHEGGTIDAGFGSLLAALFDFFLVAFPAPIGNANLLPMAQQLDEWYELMPDSELFGDGNEAYAFRDEVAEARARLSGTLLKVYVAHLESAAELVGFPAVDNNLYAGLDEGWRLNPAPGILPRKYYTTGNLLKDTQKVLELLKAAYDAFASMYTTMRGRIPSFLSQSFTQYPYHNAQNGLFLAFVNLYTHAQSHLNTLGRKHLLYHYKDVLRFSERDLVPDQAVLIFQLRKGVTQHLIEKGTLLKAGKDNLGKPRYYAVSEETVVTQASIASLRTVYVERQGGIIPYGIYAAPIANSADGEGADLNEEEPKWPTFGEAQKGLEDEARTMPDAKMGFALASPIFMMKEGKREIYLLLACKKTSPSSSQYPYALEGLTNKQKRYDAEADLQYGLKAEYTSLKGWAEAEIGLVFIATQSSDLVNHTGTMGAFGIQEGAFSSGQYFVAIKVVLPETAPPFSAFNLVTHLEDFNTDWPVLKLSFASRSQGFQTLALPTLNSITHSLTGNVGLYEGNAYSIASNKATLLETYEEVLPLKFSAYNPNISYNVSNKVLSGGIVWTATGTVPANNAPSEDSSYWREADLGVCPYQYLEACRINTIDIRVAVEGVRGLLLENDGGKLKATKPFQPWTAQPVVGSRLFVGSQEVFGKQLDTLDLRLLWQAPPSSLAAHYDAYIPLIEGVAGGINTQDAAMEGFGEIKASGGKSGGFGFQMGEELMIFEDFRDGFTVGGVKGDEEEEELEPPALGNVNWRAAIDFLHEGKWIFMETRSVFNGTDARLENKISLAANEFTTFSRDLDLNERTSLESNTPRGFIRLELVSPNIAFGHREYKDLYVEHMTDKVDFIVNGGNDPGDPPKEPYTPVLKEFLLNYTSKVKLDLKTATAAHYADRVEQFFHVHPFGQTEEHIYLNEGVALGLLPSYPDTGYLYVGIEDLVPPSTLSVLFQLAEGSADPDLDRFAPTWSMLIDNRWVDLLPSEIPSDSTDELIASGVIKFVLDKDMNDDNTMLPSGLHWLRAKVLQNTDAIHQTIDVLAQAVPVSFSDQKNTHEHLLSALPSGSITGLKVNDAAVKKVSQPYASFGGKYPEQDDAFLTRVSERLRHKYRAINIWDYERMVLEEFPAIYKAKCLNHTQAKAVDTGGSDWEISPGYVTMVTIPDLRNVNAVNPFEPKTPLHVLDDVDTFLRKYISPWVELSVTNPQYEQIQISCEVGFVQGKDPGFYITLLEDEIKAFLSPWAFDQSVDIVFGGKIHRSQIIDFIERRTYVDFVVGFQMHQTLADGSKETDVAEAIASTARSILVTAQSHIILSVQAEEVDCIAELTPEGEVTGNCCGSNPI